ncbi:MAG: CehA/McbA family metallohydrolase [bacterium]
MKRFKLVLPWLVATALVDAALVPGCGSSGGEDNNNNAGSGCPLSIEDIPVGDPDGHPDPYGALESGQARASRIEDPTWIVQSPETKQKVRPGDFVMANSEIAVYIGNERRSDGFSAFGGEILSLDKVGADGRPLGLSHYGETLMGIRNELILPESVTVLNDGSDGEAAVVRVVGNFAPIPIFAEFSFLLGDPIGVPGYMDYALEPGSPRVGVRLGVLNNTEDDIEAAGLELHAFLHSNRHTPFTPQHGFVDSPGGEVDWLGYERGPWGFAFRLPESTFRFFVAISGVLISFGPGFTVPACDLLERDHAEFIAGGPYLDGLRATLRAVDGESPWRSIDGVVEDSNGNPLADVWVHELDGGDTYLSRTRTGADGTFLIHAPPEPVTLVPQRRGYPAHSGDEVDASTDQVTLTLGRAGEIHVTTLEAGSQAGRPVRIQVIPDAPDPPTPETYGVKDERNGRLHQEYSVDGTAALTVPTGGHRIIVSSGYEYEIHDATALVGAGDTVSVDATILRSVDTTGYLCADFHIHTYMSPDSGDPPADKVIGQLADGLDMPVFSDHEWITAAQPVVEQLGLEEFTYGITSSELTTYAWGHFGLVPVEAKPDETNNGAIDWYHRTPQEVFDSVHALPELPLIVVNHPRSPSIGGYFSATFFDPETGEGEELWSDSFDLIEAFNGSSFDSNREASVTDWFGLLDQGWDMVVLGSSDNHYLIKGPTGYPRSCMYFGHDDPTLVTPADVKEVLLGGDVFVSGGLYINVAGPDGERMGETVTTADATVPLTVTVQAASWVPAHFLEVIVNGQTQEVLDLQPSGGGPGQRFVHAIDIPMDPGRSRSWVVFHAWGDGDLSPVHPGKRPFAATNAIYLAPE